MFIYANDVSGSVKVIITVFNSTVIKNFNITWNIRYSFDITVSEFTIIEINAVIKKEIAVSMYQRIRSDILKTTISKIQFSISVKIK